LGLGSQKSPRQIIRSLWIHLLYFTGFFSRARRSIASSGGIVVLTLHRVLDDSELASTNSPAGMIVRKESFAKLLQYLKKHYDVIALGGETPSCDSHSSRVRVAITFDDGWKDTSENAFEVAEKLSVPITVFVCPGLAGKPSPFWPETIAGTWRGAGSSSELKSKFLKLCIEAGLSSTLEFTEDVSGLEVLLTHLKRLSKLERDNVVAKFEEFARLLPVSPFGDSSDSTMTWEDTVRLARHGAQIGSHTQTHQILTTLTSDEVDQELLESKVSLASKLGNEPKLFAYPNGSWSPLVRERVAHAGYERAFINAPGIWTNLTNAWCIPRVNIWEGSLVGVSGRFSSMAFEYAVTWRSFRAHLMNQYEE
jgi:peptidoglycan/xylan/chitin deacetylase (PgdA/CDA1 family)